MVAAAFTGCGSQQTSNGEKGYTIGISQFAEHGSLDNCREGFLAGLAEAGIVEGENLTVIYDNAQTDTGTASTIAENFVSKKVEQRGRTPSTSTSQGEPGSKPAYVRSVAPI